MTTHSTSSAISNASDAAFRTWWNEFRAGLAAVGMVQTSATGQLNPATHTIPGADNTASGYEIWRFNDAMQASAPILIKFEPGRGNGATLPAVFATVGTGTNGAGTITGVATARNQLTNANTTGAAAYPSYFCHVEGFFFVAFKCGAQVAATRAVAGLVICRTVDADGITPNGDAAQVYWSFNNINPISVYHQTLRFAATAEAFAQASNASFTVIPRNLSSTDVGGDKQVFLHLMAIPRVVPVFAVATYLTVEYAFGTTFSVALTGATPRTFLCLGVNLGNNSAPQSVGTGLAVLWE